MRQLREGTKGYRGATRSYSHAVPETDWSGLVLILLYVVIWNQLSQTYGRSHRDLQVVSSPKGRRGDGIPSPESGELLLSLTWDGSAFSLVMELGWPWGDRGLMLLASKGRRGYLMDIIHRRPFVVHYSLANHSHTPQMAYRSAGLHGHTALPNSTRRLSRAEFRSQKYQYDRQTQWVTPPRQEQQTSEDSP